MLTGGFIGFFLTFLASLGTGGDLNLALRDGMVGCLLMAFVSKIFYHQLENAAVSVLEAEIRAIEAEESEENS